MLSYGCALFQRYYQVHDQLNDDRLLHAYRTCWHFHWFSLSNYIKESGINTSYSPHHTFVVKSSMVLAISCQLHRIVYQEYWYSCHKERIFILILVHLVLCLLISAAVPQKVLSHNFMCITRSSGIMRAIPWSIIPPRDSEVPGAWSLKSIVVISQNTEWFTLWCRDTFSYLVLLFT